MIPHGRRLLRLLSSLPSLLLVHPWYKPVIQTRPHLHSKLAARFCEDNLLQAVVRIKRCLLPSLPFGWQVCGLVAGGCADLIAGRCANQDCWRVCGLHLLPGVWIMLAGGRIPSFKPWDRSIWNYRPPENGFQTGRMVPKSLVQSTWNVALRMPSRMHITGPCVCADWLLACVRIGCWRVYGLCLQVGE